MRSMPSALLVALCVVPVAFASCSSDETNSAEQAGGDGASGAGSPGHAGEPSHAGTSSHAGDGGSAAGGAAADGGEPGAGGGSTPPGDGGSTSGDGGHGGVAQGGEPGSGLAGDSALGGAGGEAGAPPEPSPIVLFDAGAHSGLNFGGREGLDAQCATAKQNQSIPGATTHALISVSATDELRDMPSLYGLPTSRALVGPTGKVVASDFADLLDGSLDQSLSDAGVSAAQFWLSGSNADGSVRKTCNGWTSSEFSQQVTGTYGYPGSADSNWITVTGGDVYCSASQYHVICAAY